MPAIDSENWPVQFETPAPSVTVPLAARDTFVPAAVRVRIKGEPANMEHESPGSTTAPQFVFADPAPKLVTVYRMVACVIPFPANWMNGLLGPKPAPATIGVLFAISTASAGVNAPESRQPAVPRTPLGQPANVSVVVFVTSPFHGGPGGSDAVFVLNVMLASVTVMVPLPDETFKFPMTVAKLTATKHNKTRLARAALSTGTALI